MHGTTGRQERQAYGPCLPRDWLGFVNPQKNCSQNQHQYYYFLYHINHFLSLFK
jgi:hypothetical protein